MAMFNSSANLNEDDTDVTIINHSFLYDNNDEPISTCIPVLRRQQQAHQISNNPQPVSDGRHDYIFVDHGPFDAAKQIEQILDYYRKELKQESNTQLDCNRKLITRLVDFIRPVYSSNGEKMKNLDTLFEDISILHQKRFVEQKEKNVQLHNKVRHLQKSIVSTPIEDNSGNNLMTTLYRMNSIADYGQWLEMEEETNTLHNLVKAQRDQIDQLIELLSPGETVNNENQCTTASAFPEIPDDVAKKCSLCNYEFPITFSNDQIMSHFERCLSTSTVDVQNVTNQPQQFECPYCNQKLSNVDDIAYLQHVSTCFNELNDIF